MTDVRNNPSHVPTLLVTGSNGQVGFELRRALMPLGRVIALDRAACDLARADSIRHAVQEYRPDVIVNAAACTSMDKAEVDAEGAFAVNATAVGILAEEAKRLGSLFVHYSTDCVFDGRQDVPYTETDAVNPISVYGRSKLAGEQAIADVEPAALVLRTSWVAGAHGRNFAKTMLRFGREQASIRVIRDRFGAPTGAALIADVTAQIVARQWLFGDRQAFPHGIYHLAAAGETSPYGYASEVLQYAADKGLALKTGPAQLQAIPASEYPLPAARLASARLDTGKLRATFGIHLPDWREGVHHLLDQILPEVGQP
ncbi:dTDP-4-dehydrorhamnose reductase [Cupriavidus sp. 2TAF22]|uniref:dTDP-4-dehydrorhamnose reductase n=1 Tax=unclassified Cupriavidus TaxID=2640874 RepID=UPI003F91F427